MKRVVLVFIVLALVLTSCAPPVPVEGEVLTKWKKEVEYAGRVIDVIYKVRIMTDGERYDANVSLGDYTEIRTGSTIMLSCYQHKYDDVHNCQLVGGE